MTRFLAEAEWAALTHATIITWAMVAGIFAACYGLIALPGWISDWCHARRLIRQVQAEAEFADHTQALDVTQPITTPWVMDRRGCGCGTRQQPHKILICPKHANEQLIDFEAVWQRREDAP